MKKLLLKDLNLGQTDAKNELLHNSPEEINRFCESFVAPPSLSIDRYLNGDKYFIIGLKGTGKTALLRYVSLKLELNETSRSEFVLFKSEIDEQLKKDFAKAARIQIIDENSKDYEGEEFEPVWRWFMYRKIANVLKNGASHFVEDNDLNSFCDLVGSEYLDKPEKTGLMRLVPNIRKGNIEISYSPKLGLEFDWDENGRAKVKFPELVRKADDLFARLQPGEERLNIFFDELELDYASAKQHARDAALIRDLVVTIEKLNAICKRKKYPLCLYAAIRSEVLSSVVSLGKEINKPLADFGSIIMWNKAGLDAKQQPLLNIIEQKISSSRVENGLEKIESAGIWEYYFPKKIDGKSPQIYILHNSWYRPRDIVRLLLSVQDQYPNEEIFILQGIEAVRKAYSTASWVELTEELKARYSSDEIEGIRNILYGFKQISTVAEVIMRAEELKEDHDSVAKLLKGRKIKDVLRDLFRVGIIGNIDSKHIKMRFSFRGDEDILFDHKIFIHNALRGHLSIYH